MNRRAGVILAGGYSTRFGEADKALADLAGVSMVRRVADRVAPTVDSLVVNCRAAQVESLETALDGVAVPVSFAVDPVPDEGPLYGIRTAMATIADGSADAGPPDGEAIAGTETGADYAAVVACDMPFVDPDFLAYLFDRAEGHDAAVTRLDDGWFQTTQAVYRVDAMFAACDRALDAGERRIVAPLDDLDHVVVDESEISHRFSLDTFENVNTPEEFAAASERLRERQ